ncbi:hypothetical protein ACFXA0_03020 [Streptomyces cyaneofuscatus]|uniref:hypothetical protein n=1 Tax=Streptomyces cyaneofuscatus TaxID=66883 RepID=UPI0036CB2B50
MQLRSGKFPRDAVHHPVFARFYARMSVTADLKGGVAAYREELLAGLSGRVIEIGAGNGLNFAHYPGAVSEVVALEPERSLRQLAVRSGLRAEVTYRRLRIPEKGPRFPSSPCVLGVARKPFTSEPPG